MSFESKYLIRWGIPGWVFIIFVFCSYTTSVGYNFAEINLPGMSASLTILVSLAAVGVPIGYIFHQLYFGYSMISRTWSNISNVRSAIGNDFPTDNVFATDRSNNIKDYFHFEYVWHSMLLEQDENTRTYLEGRYRNILGTIHALGALWMSAICSIYATTLISAVFIETLEINIFYVSILFVQAVTFLFAFSNYIYFSKNLRAFQIKMLKRYLPLKKE